MKTKLKTGYVIKSKNENGKIIFNHLLPNELHLISKICSESINCRIEVKKMTYSDLDNFINLRF